MGNTIPVAEDVVEFIKRGNESEHIALENLKTIAPAIKNQTNPESKPRYPHPSAQMIAECSCEGKCETCAGKEICWKTHFSAKQENREKEGRKIWEIIKQCYSPGLCPVCFGEEKECLVCAADAVCDYMLNKMEEVRKETMKDVMSYLYELSRGDMTNEEAACFDYIERMFCKKFGVERVESSSDSRPEVREEAETLYKLVNSDSVIGNYIIESVEKNIFEIQKQDILSFDNALSEKLKSVGYYTNVDTNDLINFEGDYSFLFDSFSQDSFKLNESNKDSLLETLTRYFRYGMMKTVVNTIRNTFQETIKRHTEVNEND